MCDCCLFFVSSRRRHTRCALVTGVQTCALPICWQRRRKNERAIESSARPFRLSQYRGEQSISADYDGWPSNRAEATKRRKIGRESWRERVCQDVYISVVDVSLKKQNRYHNTKRH